MQEENQGTFGIKGGWPLDRVIAEPTQNFDANVHIEFNQQYVRFFRWVRKFSIIDETALSRISGTSAGQGNQARAIKGNIGEFELFAQGVPQRVVYVTRMANLGSIANFGRLHWAGTSMRMENGIAVTDPDAAAWLKAEVRVGRDPDPAVYHEWTNIGREKEVSRPHYEKLTALLDRDLFAIAELAACANDAGGE